ncbi:MAG TPA: nucleotidyltransferase substrate binding protein [Chitinophagales bacterium]|nr:nucleotidyltransferase substrate binding protein [Chitinophagales bacterium]HRK27086.1 nucleotidyltransferase substrate binding protein [Chitinophagales bacterium]
MSLEDIRWKQRYRHFLKALSLLEEAVIKHRELGLNKLEEQGLIQRFEFTHELAWNVLKDYFEYQGNTEITGSRDATREAFQMGLIEDGENWMEMIRSRNLSSHTYNEAIADKLTEQILKAYFPLFVKLKETLHHRYQL